tara:strand:+ start:759 stop:1157 length:399 start_codon:yes stop_codon:yes gene_type:complete
MNNKHQNTDEILSAIRDMMSDEETNNEQPLSKDVLELTQSVEPKKNSVNQEDVLELTKLVSDNDPIVHLESINNKKDTSLENEEDEIRLLVRESIKNHSSKKIDLIIKQEMKKIIEEKLSKAQAVIDSGNKN